MEGSRVNLSQSYTTLDNRTLNYGEVPLDEIHIIPMYSLIKPNYDKFQICDEYFKKSFSEFFENKDEIPIDQEVANGFVNNGVDCYMNSTL